ncbi:MAG: hypothetical protein GVY14_03425 [Spirochaetes bacterium]|nr:hypothetical protein [Spirochaetota bacterium]
MSQLVLPLAAVVALAVSTLVDRGRTARALRIALRRFIAVLPPLLAMLCLASLALTAVSPALLTEAVSGENLAISTAIAAAIGSVALMPGFVAFPLAGILLDNGVPYTVLAAFTVSLMLVGVATFPLERAYFGARVSVVRNSLCLAIALCVALVIGLVFGELV